jgi:hypothetical protein
MARSHAMTRNELSQIQISNSSRHSQPQLRDPAAVEREFYVTSCPLNIRGRRERRANDAPADGNRFNKFCRALKSEGRAVTLVGMADYAFGSIRPTALTHTIRGIKGIAHTSRNSDHTGGLIAGESLEP